MAPVAILREPLYDRQFGESRQAFAAFCVYRDMGKTRSQDAAYRSTRPSGSRPVKARNGKWHEWGTCWRWAERAAAWDDHLDAEQRKAQEDTARAEGERLAGRRRDQRNTEIDLADQLIRRAREMLALPVVEVEQKRDTETGQVTQVFKPGKWTLGTAAKFVEVATMLRRLALDMETSRASVRIDVEDEVRLLARANGWDEDSAVEMARRFADERGDRLIG